MSTGDLNEARQVFDLPHVSTATAALFITYFVGGFLLYSAMFAAVGAMSSTEQEARQAQQPVTWLLVLSFVSMFAMLNDPGSPLDRKSTRLNSSHGYISYAVLFFRKNTRLNSSHGYISYGGFCLKKKTVNESVPSSQHSSRAPTRLLIIGVLERAEFDGGHHSRVA